MDLKIWDEWEESWNAFSVRFGERNGNFPIESFVGCKSKSKSKSKQLFSQWCSAVCCFDAKANKYLTHMNEERWTNLKKVKIYKFERLVGLVFNLNDFVKLRGAAISSRFKQNDSKLNFSRSSWTLRERLIFLISIVLLLLLFLLFPSSAFCRSTSPMLVRSTVLRRWLATLRVRWTNELSGMMDHLGRFHFNIFVFNIILYMIWIANLELQCYNEANNN